MLLDIKTTMFLTDPEGEDKSTFIRNVIGTATGMLMFRESMRDTNGENVYRCWKDIEAWRHIDEPVKRVYWKYAIKNKYITAGSQAEVKSRAKFIAYHGMYLHLPAYYEIQFFYLSIYFCLLKEDE